MIKRLFLILIATQLLLQLGRAEEKKTAPIFKPMPDVHFKADTKQPLAQTYFNQGWVFFYGFNYIEATRSFSAASQLDKNCHLCQWAHALSLSSTNNTFLHGDELTHARQLLKQAQQTKDKRTQALVHALSERLDYRQSHALAKNTNITYPDSNSIAFANDMYAIAQAYPKDVNLQVLFAFSVFDVVKWQFWDSSLKPKPYTNLAREQLNTALKADPNHVGAIHYLIHISEWSAKPEKALPAAQKLAKLAPLVEHLVHMPAHTYLRLGLYNKAIKTNQHAIRAHSIYIKQCQRQGFSPALTFLYLHDYEFLVTSAMWAQNYSIAYKAAYALRDRTPLGWLNTLPMLERFYAMKMWTMIRFQEWQALLHLPHPPNKYAYWLAMWHYAQASASLGEKDLKTAKQHLSALQVTKLDKKTYQADMQKHLQLAILSIRATIAQLENKPLWAANLWQQAVHIESTLKRKDPPSWFQPIANQLALSLIKIQPKQAIAIFDSVLQQYPNNKWSLQGKEQALRQLRQ